MNDEKTPPSEQVEILACSPLHAAAQLIPKLNLDARDLLILATSILNAVAFTANRDNPDVSPFMGIDMEAAPLQIAIATLNVVANMPCTCEACTSLKRDLRNRELEEVSPLKPTRH